MAPPRGDIGGIKQLREMYKEYAFIEDQAEPGGAGKAEAGATHKWLQNASTFVNRTYENPVKWYFIVWKPYDRAYEKDPDWFAVKGINSCRRKLIKPECFILTREILATKIHINGLVATDRPMMSFHEKDHCNRYKMSVYPLLTLADRQRVLDYVSKESKKRTFTQYLDYVTYLRP